MKTPRGAKPVAERAPSRFEAAPPGADVAGKPSLASRRSSAITGAEAEVEALWLQLAELFRQASEARRRLDEAEASIPEDLRPGPTFAGESASRDTDESRSGWPVLRDAIPPSIGLRRVRWAPSDFIGAYETQIARLGDDGALEWIVGNLGLLHQRRTLQREACEAAAIDPLSAAVGRLLEEIDAVLAAIRALPCQGPRVFAARALADWGERRDEADAAGQPMDQESYAYLFHRLAEELPRGLFGGPLRRALALIADGRGGSSDRCLSSLSAVFTSEAAR